MDYIGKIKITILKLYMIVQFTNFEEIYYFIGRTEDALQSSIQIMFTSGGTIMVTFQENMLYYEEGAVAVFKQKDSRRL